MYVYIHTDDLSSYIHTRTQDKANKKRDRSQIVLEVKPTDTDVNLDDLYSTIKKEISPSGLTCACVARVVCCLQGGARSLPHLIGSDSLLACHDSLVLHRGRGLQQGARGLRHLQARHLHGRLRRRGACVWLLRGVQLD